MRQEGRRLERELRTEREQLNSCGGQWSIVWLLGVARGCVFRAQEEVASCKRKLERYKSREWASASDEVLLEEIRTYKVCGSHCMLFL